jgi:predicted RNase H-like HicB family nuclease
MGVISEVNKNLNTLFSQGIAMKIGVTVHKEGNLFVAANPFTNVTSQGKTCEEALNNFQEAFELWFECAEDWEKELAQKNEPITTAVLDLKV